jgi:hypothetical protein
MGDISGLLHLFEEEKVFDQQQQAGGSRRGFSPVRP